MANSDKNIRISTNRDTTALPKIVFTGQGNSPITLNVLDDNTLSFEGSSGQLFSINNVLSSGYIFSINDISGIPSFRVNADGTVGIAEFLGNVGIGLTNPAYKLQIAGSAGISGTTNISGALTLTSNSGTSTTTSGALIVTGGVGIGQSLITSSSYASNISGVVFNNGAITNTGTITSTGVMSISNSSTTAFAVRDGSNSSKFNVDTLNGIVSISSVVASISTSTGALVITGGVGIGGSLNVGNVSAFNNEIYLNNNIIVNPTTYSAIANTFREGYLYGSYWLPRKIENYNIVTGRKVIGGSIVIADAKTGSAIATSSNPFEESLQQIKYGKDKYIAIASAGNSVAISASGTAWSYVPLPISASWTTIDYGLDKFVLLSSSSNVALYSTDGVSWKSTSMPTSGSWAALAHGNGVWVAGSGTTLAYSYNGIDWKYTLSNYSNSTWIVYGNGYFFVNGTGNTGSYSYDGISWTDVTLPTDTNPAHKETAYGNGTLFNLGNVNNHYSSNLTSWSSTSGGGAGGNYPSIFYINNKFTSHESGSGYGVEIKGPSGTIELNPRFTGEINNVRIGAITPASGEFTNLTSLNVANFPGDIKTNKLSSYGFIKQQSDVGSAVGDTIRISRDFFSLWSNYSLTYGNGLFVTVIGNVARYSYDGITWKNSTVPANSTWIDMVYAQNKFVAIPSVGTTAVLSTDGINWSSSTIPVSASWVSMAYGANKFVAISGSGSTVIYSSTGATTWSVSNLPSSDDWKSVQYGNGLFIAIKNLTKEYAYSYDGATWYPSTMPLATTFNGDARVLYGNGIFSAAKYNTAYQKAESKDGFDWTSQTVSNHPSIAWGFTYQQGLYLSSGWIGSQNYISYSTDNTNWTPIHTPDLYQPWRIAYGNGKLLFSTTNSGGGYIGSADGPSNSVDINPKFTGELNNVRIGYKQPSTANFTNISSINSSVLLGKTKTENLEILSYLIQNSNVGSVGGTTFTINSSEFAANYSNIDIAFGNGIFVNIRSNSSSFDFSSDGYYWQSTGVGVSASWSSAIYGKDKFVAISSNGSTAVYSTSGLSWTVISLPVSAQWSGITYGKDQYVAIASNGNTAAISPDGITWTSATLPSDSNLSSVTYGNGMFVAVGNTTNAAYSFDGSTWYTTTIPVASDKIIYGNGYFVTAGSAKTNVYISKDALNWETSTQTGTASAFYKGLLYANGVYYRTRSTDLLYSTDLVSWNTSASLSGGGFTNIASGNNKITLTGNSRYSARSSISTGTINLHPKFTGDIDNVRIGSNQAASAEFTNLSATQIVRLTSPSPSTDIRSGALVVVGGVGIGGSINVNSASNISNVLFNNGIVYGDLVGTANTAGFATTSSYAYESGYGATSGFATTSSYSYQSGYAITSGSSGSATTASNLNVVSSASNSAHTLLFSPTATGSGVAVSSNTTLSYNPSTNILYSSGLAITSTAASTSTSNGALQVAGGVGISGRLTFNQASFGTTGISSNPTMAMIGFTGDPIYLSVLEDNTISFEGSQGQLFSITPNLSTGYIYSVNDITGIPLLRANANANVTANEYAGNFGIGLSSPAYKLHVIGSVGFTSTTASISTSTGTLIVSGGVGIGGSLNVGSASNISSVILNSGTVYGNLTGTATTATEALTSNSLKVTGSGSSNLSHLILFTPNSSTSGSAISSDTTISFNPSTEILSVSGLGVTASTGSISTSTGALIVTGGVGIGGSLFVGNKSLFADEVKLTSISSNALTISGSGSVSYAWTVGSTLTSSKYILGFDLGLHPVGGNQSVIQTYWGMQLVGNSLTTPSSYSASAVGTRDAIGVLVPNQQGSKVAFGIIANASQTGDLQIWTSSTASTSSPYLSVKSDGQIYSYINKPSTSYDTGALVVTGGVGIGGSLFVNGDLTINGTTTTINSVTLSVDDKNIELGSVSSPSDLTAEGGGITLKGSTDKNINWYTGVGWSSSESWNLASGNTYKINNTDVISSTSLGTGVTNSSLTALGTITSGVWAGTLITAYYGGIGLTTPFTVGDLLYANTSSTWDRLSAGTNGYVLSSTGTGSTPSYVNPSTLSVGFATTSYNLSIVGSGNSNLSHRILFSPNSSSSGSAVSSDSTFSFNPNTEILSVSGLAVTSTTSSTGYSSGALLVSGGVGIAGTVNILGDETVNGRLYYSQSTVGTAASSVIPSIMFVGQNNNPITLSVLADNTLSFEGSSGQLFSINNNLSSGTIFSVNDISGIPILRANANGTLSMGEFTGTVGVGLTNPSFKFQVNGSAGFSGTVYVTGNTSFASTTASTSTSTGAVIVAGGVGIGGSLNVNSASSISSVIIDSGTVYGNLTGIATTASYAYQSGYGITSGFADTSTYSYTSGYGITAGFADTSTYAYSSGYGITSGFATSSESASIANTSYSVNVNSASTNASHYLIFSPNATGSGAALSTESALVYNPSTDILSVSGLAITSGAASTSTTTGALIVSGSVGIGGSLYSGSILTAGRLQNQSFSGATIGSTDGRMGNYSAILGHDRISFGNGLFVTNSSWGAYNSAYSTDGTNWISSSLPVNQGYPVNIYGNGYFVLVATGATNVLYTTNGSSWSQASIGNTLSRVSGAYGNGKYVVVGSGLTYNYSANITSWSTGSLPLEGDWRIAYGNGMFVAIAYGTNRLIYSYDGVNWNIGNTNSTNRNFMKITYTNGKFMVTAWSGGGTWYSYDGINWNSTSNPGGDVYNVAYGNGAYFTSDSLKYTYSSDGFNWSSYVNFSAGYESFQSAYGLNKFITGGRIIDGPTNTVTIDPKFTGEINNVRIGAITPASGDFTNLSSTGSANLVGTVNANNLNVISKINQTPVLGGFAGTDGWSYSNVLTNPVFALTFGNGLFVSIRGTSSSVNVSSNGNRWIASAMPFSGDWKDVAWGKDKFVAVASAGTTGAYSGNGISWTSMNMPSTTSGWYAVTYGDDKFVAVGNGATTAYSSDGITWTGAAIANTNWTGIAYGNGTFVAVAGVGRSGAYSYDGINWNSIVLPSATGGATSKFITYGNGYFIVTNYVSTAIDYSRDGINWSTSTRTSGYNIHTDLAYGNGIYSILNYNEASFSYDGINWLNSNNITSTDWQAVAYGNNRFVATSVNTGNVATIDGPSNTLNLHPKFTGDIDNVRIGAKQPGAAEFTNLAAQQPVRFTANTTSLNTNTGALVVVGGVGIGGSVYTSTSYASSISGLNILNGSLSASTGTIAATNKVQIAVSDTSSFVVADGSSTAKLSVDTIGGIVSISSSTASTSSTTGALIVTGGVGIGQTLFTSSSYASSVSGVILDNGTITGTLSGYATTSNNVRVVGAGNSNLAHPILFTPASSSSGSAVSSDSTFFFNSSTEILSVSGLAVTSGTASTSSTTGALVVTGGVGIGLTLTVGLGVSTPLVSAPNNLLLKPGVDSTTGIQFTRSSTALPVLTIDTLNSRVGIGLTNPEYDLEVNGSVSATLKSFIINHPTKDGMKLRYSSLEGPENGVYVRGELKNNNVIELPDYWLGLVDESTITVHLTPVGNKFVYVKNIKDNKVYVGSMFFQKIHCYYSVWAERKDVPKLKVEF